jgi:uncharacterized protein
VSGTGFLLDVNAFFALSEEEHEDHRSVMRWFDSRDSATWGTCTVTEAGFVRLASNPKVGGHTLEEAARLLAAITALPGYRFWPVSEGWSGLTNPFAARLFGHQQVTDAVLLGLAVKENAVLVTLDRGVRFLAGRDFDKHVLLLA